VGEGDHKLEKGRGAPVCGGWGLRSPIIPPAKGDGG